jgi:dTDP-4-amino-4,6-dideoxygalactose transaminase
MIKFFDTQKLNKTYENAFQSKLKSLKDSCWSIQVDEVKLFENFAENCQSKKCIGLETMIHYLIAPHKQKALKNWNHLSFPITEKNPNEILSLPISPVITTDEIDLLLKKLMDGHINKVI